MRCSKNWLPEEDQALLELHLTRGFCSWARINQFLINQFKITNKTPKLCRERFLNHLNPAISRHQWTPAEESTLIALQSQLGNRWAEISRHLPGRTDNSVKNKFFSKYRQALKNLNLLLVQNRPIRSKTVKIGFVYKLINLLGSRDLPLSPLHAKLVKNAEIIRNEIISFEEIDTETMGKQEDFHDKIEGLMIRIQLFSSSIKRKHSRKKMAKDSKSESVIQSEEVLPLHPYKQQPALTLQKPESPNKKQSQSEPLTTIPNFHPQQQESPSKRPSMEYLFRGMSVQNEDHFWNLQPCGGIQFFMAEY